MKFSLLSFFLITFMANAQNLINEELGPQLKEQKRGYELHKNFSLASDIELWKYFGDGESAYHGAGYYADIFYEFRATSKLQINLRQSFINGTISDGYIGADDNFNFLGLTWYFNNSKRSKLRFFDLGKRTLGSGVFVEENYVSGLYYSYKKNKGLLEVYLLGTSGISISGDLYTIGYERVNKNLSPGVILYNFNTGTDFSGHNSFDVLVSPYLKSSDESFLKLDLEGAYNIQTSKYSVLSKLGIQNRVDCKFCFKLYGQYRFYQPNSTVYTSFSSYTYVPYNLIDRNFHNTQNLFSLMSNNSFNLQSMSAHFDFEWKLSDKYKITSFHEYVEMKSNGATIDEYYHKGQLEYVLPDLNQSYAYAYISNKVLTNGSFRFATNVYKENFIVGGGAKIFF